ncbi:MAG TPA: hypothetical protein VEJ36_01080 [Nitrososphaerales archaeon]|nr:hypothetical protein [Nitrososphaerales archaeon]
MSQGNADIRQTVEDNRGSLKKLQLIIPGLRGYREKEDIRVSDELLRNQMADKLDGAKSNLETVRKQLASANDFTNLTSLGSVIWQIQSVSGEVRHAAQGYSGWVAPITINEDKLNKLYDYDYDFVSSVLQLETSTSPSNVKYDPASPNAIQSTINQLTQTIAEIKQKWSTRMEAIEGIAIQQ